MLCVVAMASPRTRVLIVDDEDNHRRTLAIGLRLEAFDVQEARDGEAAIELCESGADFDVAIVDLMMPGINGLDLARRLRTRRPDVRVVLTSAYHLSERQLERADVGAIGFVPKPYHLDELVAFLRAKVPVSACA
jgi:DNA-binding response OmpR family regulator